MCIRNSSLTLNTLTFWSSYTRIMHHRVPSKPCWDGIPKQIDNTTLRHFYRKWKSHDYTCTCICVCEEGVVQRVRERGGVGDGRESGGDINE